MMKRQVEGSGLVSHMQSRPSGNVIRFRDEMKSILVDSSINHKFVKGMTEHRPEAKVYRKSGTWRNYHSDSALVERADGRKYIAVGLAQIDSGSQLLEQIIVNLDQAIDQYQ